MKASRTHDQAGAARRGVSWATLGRPESVLPGLLISVVAIAAVSVVDATLQVSNFNPAGFLVLGIIAAGYFWGIAGVFGALVPSVAYAALRFSEPGMPFVYADAGAQHLALFTLASLAGAAGASWAGTHALRDRARLRALLATSADAVLITDLSGRILEWSTGAQRLYGYTSTELVGRSVRVLHPDPESLEQQQLLDDLGRGRPIGARDVVRRRKDGTLIDVSLSLSPIVVRGAAIGAFAVARDVTSRNRAAAADASEARALRALDRQREEFLSLMAHELREPAGSIGLLADALAEAPGLEARERHAAIVLRDQAARLRTLAEDVLIIGQIEAGEMRLDLVDCDLSAIVRTALEPFADPRLVRPSSATVLPVRADPTRLRHAVRNLVSNALKYSAEPSAVAVACGERGGSAYVSVTDQGIGLTEDERAVLFQKYRRTSSAAAEGIGLGLYLTRLIVERHGGVISASSGGRGRGSVFTIEVPIRAT